MAPFSVAVVEAPRTHAGDDRFERLRSVVDNCAMVATGMEDGMEWVRTRTFPAREERQPYAHRLVELRRYRQGFAIGSFLIWLDDSRAGMRGAADAVMCLGDAIRLCDPQSGERMDWVVPSMRPRAAARVLRHVAAELARAPRTRVDIVVHSDHVALITTSGLHLVLRPRHPCPRTAAHLLRNCLGATAAGLRIQTPDQ